MRTGAAELPDRLSRCAYKRFCHCKNCCMRHVQVHSSRLSGFPLVWIANCVESHCYRAWLHRLRLPTFCASAALKNACASDSIMHVSNTHLYSPNSACAWGFLLCLRVGSPLAKTCSLPICFEIQHCSPPGCLSHGVQIEKDALSTAASNGFDVVDLLCVVVCL